MPLSPSLDLDNEYFRVEHILDAKNGRKAISEFSVGNEAKGLERYLKESALSDEKEQDARTYLVRDAVTDEVAAYFSLRAGLVPVPITDDDIYTIQISLGIRTTEEKEDGSGKSAVTCFCISFCRSFGRHRL